MRVNDQEYELVSLVTAARVTELLPKFKVFSDAEAYSSPLASVTLVLNKFNEDSKVSDVSCCAPSSPINVDARFNVVKFVSTV